MNNKTSQKTEEENMLDETFGGFDEEMEARTEEPDTAPVTGEKKKTNNNMIIGVVVGLAAVGAVGWLFFGKNNTQTVVTPVPVVAQQQQPTQQTPTEAAILPAPVVATNNQAGNFLEPQVDGKNPLAGNKAVDSNHVATTTIDPSGNVNVNPVVGTTTTVTTTPVANSVNPVNKVEPVTTAINVTPNTSGTGNNLVQQALVDQLKQMFDEQTREIKSSVDQVGGRVTDLEKANKSIEERLARLEAGKPTRVSNDGGTERVKSTVNKPKKVYRKVVAKAKPVQEPVINQDKDVLVNKSGNSVSSVSSVNVAPVSEIKIHSVYAGRVWTKNKDGSLSTYAKGDILPSGETVIRVDDNNAEIVTNKRVIKSN